jgi:hypothetical protein
LANRYGSLKVGGTITGSGGWADSGGGLWRPTEKGKGPMGLLDDRGLENPTKLIYPEAHRFWR